MQRARAIPEQGFNRRRHRSFVESKDGGPTLDLDTPEGLKARHKIAEQDIEDLKRKWREEEEAGTATGQVAVIDLGSGPVYLGFTRSHWVKRESTMTMLSATLDTAGSSDVTAGIYIDGVFQETVTIPSGNTSLEHECSIDVDAGALWQMYVNATVLDALGLIFYGAFE